MKIVIVGGGTVGSVAAELLSRFHDVLVIDRDETTADDLKSRLNVAVLCEEGTNPRIMRYAIDQHGADVVLSTLSSDPENLFVCMMTKIIDPSIRTIATVDDPDFVKSLERSGYLGIENMISPGLVTAEMMYQLCVLENAVEYESVKQVGACVAVFLIPPRNRVVGGIVMELPVPDGCTVFALERDGYIETAPETMEIHPGDRLYVFGSGDAIQGFDVMMGSEDVGREFCVLGGTIVGANVAKMLSDDPVKRFVKIIDKDPKRCRELSRELDGVLIINRDYLDPDVQSEENIFKSDVLVSTSEKDDTNLLVCMSAKRHSSRKVITRFFMKEYQDIFRYTDLQTIMGYERVISNEVTRCLLPEETAIARMQGSDGVLFIHRVDDLSKLRGRFVGDIQVPDGLRIVALRRGDELIYPRLDTRVLKDDEAVVFSNGNKESEIARALGRRTEPGLRGWTRWSSRRGASCGRARP